MWHGQWTQPLMMVTRRHCDGVTGVTTSCWWITTSQLQTKTIRNTQHQHSLLCSVSVIKYNRKNNFLFKEVWTVVLLSWLYFSVPKFIVVRCCVVLTAPDREFLLLPMDSLSWSCSTKLIFLESSLTGRLWWLVLLRPVMLWVAVLHLLAPLAPTTSEVALRCLITLFCGEDWDWCILWLSSN